MYKNYGKSWSVVEEDEHAFEEYEHMFELESATFFNNGINLGHATIIMKKNNQLSKFEIIFRVDENDEWYFYYENDFRLNEPDQADFENWFVGEAPL